MIETIHTPGRDIASRLRRRLSRHTYRRTVRPCLSRGLVSLSFDDCPQSVAENALPMIEDKGWRATIYASMGLCGTTNHLGLHMSEDELLDAHRQGHEIADHTYSHLDGMRVGLETFIDDIERNRSAFESIGLPEAETFAYPYGEVTPSLKRAVNGRFRLARGIHHPHGGEVDLGLAPAGRLYSAELNTTLDLIKDAAREKRWLILFGHDVRENPSDYGCTPDELGQIVDLIAALSLDVSPIKDGVRKTIP
ncbi:polysaccharide deacetylase family protein [uncultured Algimonas sp.]|uniref:polysaccharide deacetylase family protein n=1 Tax=uncultured Algimonas sp. TaxID=1547920 RepID=UPI002619FADB|nr:polysaccharide deacetylase family protein [uncultured Algimonas sp.]